MSNPAEFHIHYNQSLQDGIIFWADETSDGERVLYTNLKWYFSNGLCHEWGHAGSTSLRLAMEIVENVLKNENFQGEFLGYGKQFYSVPGQHYCF